MKFEIRKPAKRKASYSSTNNSPPTSNLNPSFLSVALICFITRWCAWCCPRRWVYGRTYSSVRIRILHSSAHSRLGHPTRTIGRGRRGGSSKPTRWRVRERSIGIHARPSSWNTSPSISSSQWCARRSTRVSKAVVVRER